MSESKLRAARIVSVVAATVISLSCGTNVCHVVRDIFVQMLIKLTVRLFSMGPSIRDPDEAHKDGEQSNSEWRRGILGRQGIEK